MFVTSDGGDVEIAHPDEMHALLLAQMRATHVAVEHHVAVSHLAALVLLHQALLRGHVLDAITHDVGVGIAPYQRTELGPTDVQTQSLDLVFGVLAVDHARQVEHLRAVVDLRPDDYPTGSGDSG